MAVEGGLRSLAPGAPPKSSICKATPIVSPAMNAAVVGVRYLTFERATIVTVGHEPQLAAPLDPYRPGESCHRRKRRCLRRR